MRVIIPCAGKNTRAKSVVGDCPKALYPVPDKPALGHILDWVFGTDCSSVCIVANPSDRTRFEDYLNLHYNERPIELIEQPSPAGDGDAIRLAFEKADPPFKYSREPVLLMLGDKIPYGDNAAVFFGQLNVQDDRKPPYSRLCVEQSSGNGTLIEIAKSPRSRSNFVDSITEYREPDPRPGSYFNGIAYIKRGDYLYDKLRILHATKLLTCGEYRIGGALKEMYHFGESFHGFEMRTLNVGDPQGIEKAINYYEDR